MFRIAFLSCLFLCFLSGAQVFQSDPLICTHGKRFYSGTKDSKASVRITPLERDFEIDIRVVDDRRYIHSNLLKSDHIELWMSSTTTLNHGYLMNGRLFQAGTMVDDSSSFLDFMNSDDYSSEGQKKKMFEAKDVKESSDFTGLRHWALDISRDSIIALDPEYYFYFPNSGASNIRITKLEKDSVGYTCTLRVSPEALGFSPGNIFTGAYFMVDVFDVDAEKELSVLSSNTSRNWGDPAGFQWVGLQTSVQLCQNQDPAELLSDKMYVFQQGCWKLYYPAGYAYQQGAAYERIDYHHLVTSDTAFKLPDGVQVKRITYSLGCEITIIDTIRYQYSLMHEQAFQLYYLGPKHYLLLLDNCSHRNQWGSGACGACGWCTLQLFDLNNGKEKKLYDVFYIDQEFNYSYIGERDEDGEEVSYGFRGYLYKVNINKNSNGLVMEMEVYEEDGESYCIEFESFQEGEQIYYGMFKKVECHTPE